MTRIHDISPVISSRSAVYPMDVRFSRAISHDMTRGDHLTLSSITTTLHVGAHADAPNHYCVDGADMATRPLEAYLGPCQVVSVSSGPRRVEPRDIDLDSIAAPRLLLATGTFPDTDAWRDDFASLSVELIDALASRGVRLIGIDTPSIDPAEAKELVAHSRIAHHDLCVLEGLVLADVLPGVYTLVALPLKIEGADASPVRAVLVEGGLDGE